jgi:hypothetical protein
MVTWRDARSVRRLVMTRFWGAKSANCGWAGGAGTRSWPNWGQVAVDLAEQQEAAQRSILAHAGVALGFLDRGEATRGYGEDMGTFALPGCACTEGFGMVYECIR